MRKSTLFFALFISFTFVTTSCGQHAARIIDAGATAAMDGGSDGGLGGIVDAMVDAASSDGGRDGGLTGVVDATVDAASSDAGAQASMNGSRIEVRRQTWTGGDGTHYDTGTPTLYDTQFATPCGMGDTMDGVTRCLPIVAAGLSHGVNFADAACTTEVGYDTRSGCAAPQFVKAVEGGTCPTAASPFGWNSWRVYQIGATHPGTIYVKSGANCVVGTRVAGWTYYVVGTEMAPSQFVSFTSP